MSGQSLYKLCKNCGHLVRKTSAKCPECGKSVRGKAFYIKAFIGAWIVIAIFFAIIRKDDSDSEPQNSTNQKTTSIQSISKYATIRSSMPESQEKFLATVVSAQQKSMKVKNDMAKGGIKSERDKEICSEFNFKSVSNWLGFVNSVDSNSEGLGVLSISIADTVNVQTWNNSLSDLFTNTLIKPSSNVFKIASKLTRGQLVKFSGSFFEGQLGSDCIREQSLTLDGKLQSPDFTFRFSSIEIAERSN